MIDQHGRRLARARRGSPRTRLAEERAAASRPSASVGCTRVIGASVSASTCSGNAEQRERGAAEPAGAAGQQVAQQRDAHRVRGWAPGAPPAPGARSRSRSTRPRRAAMHEPGGHLEPPIAGTIRSCAGDSCSRPAAAAAAWCSPALAPVRAAGCAGRSRVPRRRADAGGRRADLRRRPAPGGHARRCSRRSAAPARARRSSSSASRCERNPALARRDRRRRPRRSPLHGDRHRSQLRLTPRALGRRPRPRPSPRSPRRPARAPELYRPPYGIFSPAGLAARAPARAASRCCGRAGATTGAAAPRRRAIARGGDRGPARRRRAAAARRRPLQRAGILAGDGGGAAGGARGGSRLRDCAPIGAQRDLVRAQATPVATA